VLLQQVFQVLRLPLKHLLLRLYSQQVEEDPPSVVPDGQESGLDGRLQRLSSFCISVCYLTVDHRSLGLGERVGGQVCWFEWRGQWRRGWL
jgi:hypothetical protein